MQELDEIESLEEIKLKKRDDVGFQEVLNSEKLSKRQMDELFLDFE